MRRNNRKNNNFKKILINHVNNNIKSYTILVILFLIGIVLGVLFINNADESQKNQIQGYITGFVDSLKSDYEIDNAKLLKNSIIDNLTLAVILWFISSTVIGIIGVYGIIVYRGFCIRIYLLINYSKFRNWKWNNILNYINFITKYFVYTVHTISRCKWS